jgi:hypothetical protein
VKGHESVLAFGMIGQMSAVVMLGRVSHLSPCQRIVVFFIWIIYHYLFCDPRKLHPYEGHPVSTVIFPIRVFALLGVKNMISSFLITSDFKFLSSWHSIRIVTNASGALNPNIGVGTSELCVPRSRASTKANRTLTLY